MHFGRVIQGSRGLFLARPQKATLANRQVRPSASLETMGCKSKIAVDAVNTLNRIHWARFVYIAEKDNEKCGLEFSSPTLGTATPVRLNLIGVSFCSWLFCCTTSLIRTENIKLAPLYYERGEH